MKSERAGEFFFGRKVEAQWSYGDPMVREGPMIGPFFFPR